MTSAEYKKHRYKSCLPIFQFSFTVSSCYPGNTDKCSLIKIFPVHEIYITMSPQIHGRAFTLYTICRRSTCVPISMKATCFEAAQYIVSFYINIFFKVSCTCNFEPQRKKNNVLIKTVIVKPSKECRFKVLKKENV